MPKDQNKLITKTREQLYEMYMQSLKENEMPWEKPWKSSNVFNPVNPISTVHYHGINRMLLGIIATNRNIEDGRWATFNQIADKNGTYHPGKKWTLKKGSKGVPIELWKVRKIGTKELINFSDYRKILEKDPDQAQNYTLYSQTFYVYNFADIDGVPEMKKEKTNTVSIPELENFCNEVLKNIGVGLEHKGDQAYYIPSKDQIVLPEIGKFKSAEDYYATRLHETAHSTGAASRLKRDLSGTFGSESYAKEELRAEIASSLIFADLKMPTDASTLDNHKAYIQNWISVLEKDPNVLFAAIKDAEAISDYVLSHAPLALKEIKEHQKTNCADYVKKSVKDDFEHERISEKEYRYLTRHIDQMGDTMQNRIKGNTTEEKHDAYEELKKMMLAEAGFLVAESIAHTDELQINPLNNAQTMVL